MKSRCIFHFPEQRQTCEILRAVQGRPISTKALEYFQSSYCTTDDFVRCPIFREFEHDMAEANVQLDRASAASLQLTCLANAQYSLSIHFREHDSDTAYRPN